MPGDREDRLVHGQPEGRPGAVGEAADVGWRGGRLGWSQAGPVRRGTPLPQPGASPHHESKIHMLKLCMHIFLVPFLFS